MTLESGGRPGEVEVGRGEGRGGLSLECFGGLTYRLASFRSERLVFSHGFATFHVYDHQSCVFFCFTTFFQTPQKRKISLFVSFSIKGILHARDTAECYVARGC